MANLALTVTTMFVGGPVRQGRTVAQEAGPTAGVDTTAKKQVEALSARHSRSIRLFHRQRTESVVEAGAAIGVEAMNAVDL